MFQISGCYFRVFGLCLGEKAVPNQIFEPILAKHIVAELITHCKIIKSFIEDGVGKFTIIGLANKRIVETCAVILFFDSFL